MDKVKLSGVFLHSHASLTNAAYPIAMGDQINSLSALPTPVWGVLDLDKKLEAAKKTLGERWLLHPKHSPKKSDYDPWGKK